MLDRSLLPQPQQPGQRLHRLSQPHVIGQDAPKPVGGQVRQKMEALNLIRTQLGRHAAGQIGRHPSFNLARAPLDLRHLLLREKFLCGFVGQLQGMQALRFGREATRAQAQPGQALVFLLAQVIPQAPPSLALQPHVTAFGIEQQLDFLGPQGGVRNVEHHAQVEPINPGFRGVQPDPSGHVGSGQRGQIAARFSARS